MAKVDRTVLISNDQDFGQVADPNKLETQITHAFDKIDENDNEFIAHKKQVDPTSADTTRDKHVSNNDLKGLQDQITTNLNDLTTHKKQVDPTSSDTVRDKHVANNDLKVLQDQITTNNTASNNRDNTHKNAVVLDHPDQSVTTSKIKDLAVTSGKIAVGAVGRNQLDPTLFEQTANASKFQEIDAQLADIANVLSDNLLFTDERRIDLSYISDEGHLTTYDGSKAVNGIYTVNGAVTSGYISNASAVYNANWVNYAMPIGVLLGDSIMEGHEGAHGRLHTSTGIVDLNKTNEIGQISYYIEKELGIKIYNHGIGGQTTQQMRDRFNRDVLAQDVPTLTPTKTLDKKPYFAILGTAINDVFQNVDINTTKANIEFMVNSMIDNKIRPIVFNCGVSNSFTTSQILVAKEYNEWLKELSLSLPQMVLIDFYNWGNDVNNDGRPISGIFSDNTHPTKKSYEILAKKVMDEAFNRIVPRPLNLGISTAIDPNSSPSSLSRPELIMVGFNNSIFKLYRLENKPYQIVDLDIQGIAVDTLSIKLISGQQPIEGTTFNQGRKYLSEIWLTDKVANIKPIGKAATLTTTSGVSACRLLTILAGVHNVVDSDNRPYITGVNIATTTANSVCIVEGLTPVNSDVVLVENDYIYALTGGKGGKVSDMATQVPVAKVIKSVETNYYLCKLL